MFSRCLFLMIALLTWSFSFAQQSMRLTEHWDYLRQDLGGIWEAVRPQTKNGPETLPLWDSVRLPHCVNARDGVDPDGNYYRGPAWYRTRLALHNPYAKGRTLLHFEGAGQKTDVFIYTTKVASHTGGYDEWTVDITEAVKEFSTTGAFEKQFKGMVPLSIRTDNSRDLEMIPSGMSDFNVYGGIYRHLDLVYLPPLSIDQLFLQASVDASGRAGSLDIKARLYDPLSVGAATITIRLIDPGGKTVQSVEKKIDNTQGNIPLAALRIQSPALWSTDHPQLYTVETELRTNDGNVYRRSEKTGFRNFEFLSKGPFQLNGKRLLIRGTQRHEDGAGTGAALTDEMVRRELIMIKEMGANFIRLGHYQQSALTLALCDSLGLLVWEEIPWCRGGLGGPQYQEQARRMLTNMVEQHYNHPSIILWGLGNENDWPGDFTTFDKEKIRAFMKTLHDLSHSLDPSRKTAIRRCDFCRDIVDVYSPTLWAGWYRGFYTEYKQMTEEEFQKTDHFIHMEWGGDSHAGRFSEQQEQFLYDATKASLQDRIQDTSRYAQVARVSKNNDWSESYICNLFDWHLKEQEKMPWLTGTAQWVFKDFATPLRPDNPVPYVNQKGVVERDLTPKEGYYVFQSYWSQKPMVHIFGHGMPMRWGGEGEEKMIRVYSNCGEAELFVNGKSYGWKKRNSQDFPAAGLRWNVVFAKGENTVKVVARNGRGDKMELTDEIRFLYQVEKWGKPAKAVLERVSGDEQSELVELRLLDERNVLCADAANWVRFGLAGDGHLQDDLGTPSGSRYVQLSNGRARIRVQKNGGKSVISAKVDGTPVVFLNL